MTGRTPAKFMRVYLNGYRMSGYTSQIGPLGATFTETAQDALLDAVSGALPGRANVSPGTLNGLFDNSTAGLHTLFSGSDVARHLLVAIGDRAEPAQGVPVFGGVFRQGAYQGVPGDEAVVTATVAFPGWDVNASLLFAQPWGYLLHADGAETAVNTAVGIDDFGAATAYGGYFVYQLFSSDGTVTLKVQDAAINLNASFADLSGATSGSINASVTPAAGLVAVGATDAVRRYLRWQLVFGTATTATFCVAFCRTFYPG